MRAKQPLGDHLDWCGSSHSKVKVVLFIPGHWGSYTQSRSLGAHGLRLTGKADSAVEKSIIDSLGSGALSGDALNEESFIYEVLSVDFAGQGAALHGHFLRSQANYVGASVKHISHVCNVDSITLVGHSMGGIVARLVPVLYPEGAHLVRNIITLASPHSNPIYAFDYSIKKVYDELNAGWSEETLVISVSAGLRDEFMDDSTLLSNTASFSILATEMPTLTLRGEFGMDHQAITWCFDVLSSLRKVIWALSTSSDKDVSSRLKAAKAYLGGDSFATNYLSSKYHLYAKFGVIHASSIESGFFYNVPNLLSLFCILGCLRCSFSSESDTHILLLTAICGWCFCDISASVTLILTIVASLVHTLVSSTVPVGFCRGKILGPSIAIFSISFTLALILVLQFSGVLVDKKAWHYTDAYIFLFVICWISCCLFLIVGFSRTLRQKCDLSFVSLAVVVAIEAAIGPSALILWGGRLEAGNWQSLLLILFSVSLYHMQQRRRMENEVALTMKSHHSLCLGMSIAGASKWILARGHGYRLVLVIPALAISDIICTRLARKGRRREKDS